MICTNDVGSRALLVGGVATWLTAISTGKDWFIKDYCFVLAVMVAVLVGGVRKERYERLEMSERMQRASVLKNIDFIYGDPVQLKLNKVTCILFFGTWCRMSREALEMLSNLHQTILSKELQFVALTQESREELAMYEVKGRDSSNFRELKEFPFTIGIETGLMSKEYLVRCNHFTVPQLFIVGKNKSILWHGNPCAKIVQTQIRLALAQNDGRLSKELSAILPDVRQVEDKQLSIAA